MVNGGLAVREMAAKGSAAVRELTSEDMGLLLSLRMEVLAHVFSEERQELTDHEWEEIRKQNEDYYQKELNRNGHIACALSVSGNLAGCGGVCLYREMPSPDNRSGCCAYLMNIYVREAYRRQGLARKICQFLIRRAHEKGAEKIYLESSQMAVPLYTSLGFTDMSGYMKLEGSN